MFATSACCEDLGRGLVKRLDDAQVGKVGPFSTRTTGGRGGPLLGHAITEGKYFDPVFVLVVGAFSRYTVDLRNASNAMFVSSLINCLAMSCRYLLHPVLQA